MQKAAGMGLWVPLRHVRVAASMRWGPLILASEAEGYHMDEGIERRKVRVKVARATLIIGFLSF